MSRRAAAIDEALRVLAPRLPARDRAAVVDRALGSRQMRAAPAPASAWAALVGYGRHGFTDYDRLLAEGYGREAARHFTAAALGAVLRGWGCREIPAADGERGGDLALTPDPPSL
ncbi:DUF2293 domain-containing protein [Zavarzinia compransoris]|uniref:DUF2293 domain-containing protein n=1 Tax=Zavarzinia compransoris TaxID=1264899 RepID=A0A317E8S7_9PROT|nr:DUF2293 domain-containing protein [Zavarzinia compransoris]PWR21713.1 DUF2293 domain-containing protein [Zavarzinia compransoris]TDP45499.1 hypothetical protein DES42_105205 [Zavarzinia compransoris]